ncbi:MAG: helix-turn-helix transcriptional regulator [Clostridia bacterium]|nr:helix-turn-helix transcriptional regulator [Clostridia bacterium]
MTLGERIKNLRIEKGLSQEGLADALEVTRQAVSKWETDGSVPDIDKLIALCDLFDVSMDYLVRGKDSETGDKAEGENKFSAAPVRTALVLDYNMVRKICGALCLIRGIGHLQGFLLFLYSIIRVDSFSVAGGGYWGWLACPLYTIAGLMLFFWEKRQQVWQSVKRIPHKLLWTAWFVLWNGSLVWYIEWEEEIDIAVRYLRYPGQHPEVVYRRYLEDLRIVWFGTVILLLAAVLLTCLTWLTFRRAAWQDTKKKRCVCYGALAAGILGLLAFCTVLILCTPAHTMPDIVLFSGLFLGFWLGTAGITVFLVLYPALRRYRSIETEPAAAPAASV